MNFEYRFTIHGRPRSKKNDNEIRGRGRRKFVGRSNDYKDWETSAVRQVRLQRGSIATLTCPVAVTVTTYLAKGQRMDWDNTFGGPFDVLEKAGVLKNDDQIVHGDRSRRLRDWINPRVEIVVTPYTEE